MTLNEIAWYLIKKYGLIKTLGYRPALQKAFKIASALINYRDAYTMPKSQVKRIAESYLKKIYTPPAPPKPIGGPGVPPPDDGVNTDEDAKKWIDALIDRIKAAYTGDADFFEDAQKTIQQILTVTRGKYEPLEAYQKIKESGVLEELEKLLPYPEGNASTFDQEYRLSNGKISLTWLTMIKTIMDSLGVTEGEITEYSNMENHFFI